MRVSAPGGDRVQDSRGADDRTKRNSSTNSSCGWGQFGRSERHRTTEEFEGHISRSDAA